MPSSRSLLRAIILGILLVFASGLIPWELMAQERYQSPRRFWTWAKQDLRALPGQFTPRLGLAVAGSGAVLLGLGRYDASLVERANDIEYDLKFRVIEEFGNVKAIRPISFLLFSGSLMTRNYRFQDAAFTSMQAVYISNVFTNALKAIFGRARPYQNEGHTVFDPFSGNSSFPSGHATTAFAFLTPWVMYYPEVLGPAFSVIALSTAFSRLVINFHWVTDVMAGGAIGFTTAFWLSRRHLGLSNRFRVVPQLSANRASLVLHF